jgi:DNA invertase Pin-like site-specific DNA recombinase
MSENLRGVFYGRKSDNDDGDSIEQQREWARQACSAEGVELVREFADQAKRGWDTAARTDFHEMLAFCKQQARQGTPIDVIVCWNANRFSRADSQETSWFIWEFRLAGVGRMLTAPRWIDFGRMEDRILFNIEQDASHHPYVVNLARDSTRGRIKAARNASYNGGSIPYAYRLYVGPDGRKRLVLGPAEEVETVRWIFLTYAAGGIGCRAIAEQLTRRKVPTPTGGEAWAQSTVRDILSNPAYLGRLVWNRRRGGKFFGVVDCKATPRQEVAKGCKTTSDAWVVSEVPHEAIIDPETFERCQDTAGRRSGGEKTPRSEFLLSGLVKCGHCGSAMIGRTYRLTEGGKRYVYHRYYCGGYNRGGKAVCESNGIDADQLARAVLRKLREGWLNPEKLAALREEIRRQDKEEGRGADPGQVGRLRVLLNAAERKVRRAADRLLDEEDEGLLPDLRARLKERQKERDALAAELEAAERAPERPGDAEAEVDAAVAMMEQLDRAEAAENVAGLRDVLREAVSFIELWFDHQPYGKKTRSVFARGLIFRRTDLRLDSISGRSTQDPRT